MRSMADSDRLDDGRDRLSVTIIRRKSMTNLRAG